MNIVKELRERAGMQQKEVAMSVGVSGPTVSEWEHGKKDPSGDRLRKLSELFHVDPGIILGYRPLTAEEYKTPNIIPLSGQVPLVGEIACGTPILAQENIEGTIATPDGVRADFALRCKGASMEPTFRDGDLVLIRQQDDADDGKIAAVLIGSEATLKRLHRIPDGLMLLPENTAAFAPQIYQGEEAASVRIIGVAVGFVRMI